MTPLGSFAVDAELARLLLSAHPSFSSVVAPHEGEHSVEAQLPFLSYVTGAPLIVPIVTNDVSPEARAALVAVLVQAGHSKRLLVIASTDMTHYRPAEVASRADHGTLDLVAKLDAKGLAERLAAGEGQLCGAAAALIAIDYAKVSGARPTVLAYSTSADAGTPRDSVVGYGAVGFFVSDAGLPEKDKKELLSLARRAIARRIEGAGTSATTVPSGKLSRPAAVFVTLWEGGQLRGCIGTLRAEAPLSVAVERAAVGAAFGDPRFSPLETYDLDRIRLEISVLGELVPARFEEIDPASDGVVVESGDKSGLFLPGVGRRMGWDRKKWLDELCVEKAGLSPGCWENEGAKLYKFSTEEFGETEPGGA